MTLNNEVELITQASDVGSVIYKYTLRFILLTILDIHKFQKHYKCGNVFMNFTELFKFHIIS